MLSYNILHVHVIQIHCTIVTHKRLNCELVYTLRSWSFGRGDKVRRITCINNLFYRLIEPNAIIFFFFLCCNNCILVICFKVFYEPSITIDFCADSFKVKVQSIGYIFTENIKVIEFTFIFVLENGKCNKMFHDMSKVSQSWMHSLTYSLSHIYSFKVVNRILIGLQRANQINFEKPAIRSWV